MKTKMILGLLLIAGALSAGAQQRYELTVKEAVDLAYKNVVELKNAQLDYRIQVAKNREILGQAYPQLAGNLGANHYLKLPAILFPDATSTAVYQILKNEGVQGSTGPITEVPAPQLRQVSFQQPWNLTAGATLTQLLFQPDVFVGLQARQTALDLSQAQIDQVKDRVKDSAYKRYYAILVAQKQLSFIDSGLLRLRRLFNDDSLAYVNGFQEALALDRDRVQIANLTNTRNQVATAIDLSYAALKFAIGLSQKDTVVLREDLASVNLREGILVDDFKYEDRPEIRALGQVKRLQELDLKRNRLGYLPTVAAAANYTLNGFGQKFFTHRSTTYIGSAFIGLNVTVPLFDGGQRRYKIEQSRLNVEKAENNITNVKQAIDLQQVVTRQSLLTAIANLEVLEQNMELARKVLRTTRIKFQQGVPTSVQNPAATSSYEVILAENDLLTAEANYIQALYNAVVARTSYFASLGRL